MARVPLPIDISKDGLHSIESAVDSFESTGPFTVSLRNHGRAVHVHCNLDDDLARVASLPETNHFVETDSELTFPVDVQTGQRPVSGRLKIVTGYGAEEQYIPVTITEPKPVGPPSERKTAGESGSEESSLDSLPLDGSLPVLVLAGIALVVALGAAATIGSLEVLFGVGVVVVGVAVALWILFA
ncbi:DUF7524 family protein [Haloarchaeobius sp. DYHT-AS-18]|uniref:DUF7524 family protein n=1 Tax=Haloarchaeobius sp. DYHT-AS-18 TaxID=3446117 RepID=UPI003EBB2AE1